LHDENFLLIRSFHSSPDRAFSGTDEGLFFLGCLIKHHSSRFAIDYFYMCHEANCQKVLDTMETTPPLKFDSKIECFDYNIFSCLDLCDVARKPFLLNPYVNACSVMMVVYHDNLKS
jgi:hypothetical protein